MVSESEIAAARTSCAPGLPLALPSALLISQHSSRCRSGMHRPAGAQTNAFAPEKFPRVAHEPSAPPCLRSGGSSPAPWWHSTSAYRVYVRRPPCASAWLIELLGRIVRLTDPPSVLTRLCGNSVERLTVSVSHNALSMSTTSRTPSRLVRSSPISPPLGTLHFTDGPAIQLSRADSYSSLLGSSRAP